jgi:hypothetical protein
VIGIQNRTKEDCKMAKWKKRGPLRRAFVREGKGIARGVAKELLCIATLGLYRPTKRDRKRG